MHKFVFVELKCKSIDECVDCWVTDIYLKYLMSCIQSGLRNQAKKNYMHSVTSHQSTFTIYKQTQTSANSIHPFTFTYTRSNMYVWTCRVWSVNAMKYSSVYIRTHNKHIILRCHRVGRTHYYTHCKRYIINCVRAV